MQYAYKDHTTYLLLQLRLLLLHFLHQGGLQLVPPQLVGIADQLARSPRLVVDQGEPAVLLVRVHAQLRTAGGEVAAMLAEQGNLQVRLLLRVEEVGLELLGQTPGGQAEWGRDEQGALVDGGLPVRRTRRLSGLRRGAVSTRLC